MLWEHRAGALDSPTPVTGKGMPEPKLGGESRHWPPQEEVWRAFRPNGAAPWEGRGLGKVACFGEQLVTPHVWHD